MAARSSISLQTSEHIIYPKDTKKSIAVKGFTHTGKRFCWVAIRVGQKRRHREKLSTLNKTSVFYFKMRR